MLRSYPVISYFVLTFVIAWTLWISTGLLFAGSKTALILPGAWAPTIAALIITGCIEGRAGIRKLLSGLLRWRVGLKWYLFAVLGMTSIAIVAIVIHVVLGGSAPTIEAIGTRFGLPPERANFVFIMFPLIFLISVVAGGPIAEELGWRGFAQPRLQARIGTAPAGLVIGLIWSLWHIPLFYFLPEATGGIPAGWYIPLVTGLGVLFAWLYKQTDGSILLSILFHAGLNFGVGALGLITLTNSKQLLTIFVAIMCVISTLIFVKLRQGEKLQLQPGEVDRES